MRFPEMNRESGLFLLGIARESIEYGLAHGAPLPVQIGELPPPMSQPAASFTTLLQGGALRGCCGRLDADKAIASDVAHSAFEAAFRDPRFDPVVRDELAGIDLEVSVLTPMEPMQVADEADLLEQLRPGIDGLVIAEGARRTTFLPKVWEMLPEPQRFVAQLKAKCGLPQDYWSAELEFLRYRTATYTERS